MTRVTQLIHDAGKYLLISVYPLPTHPTHNFSHNNGGNLETLPGWPKKLQHNRPARSAGQWGPTDWQRIVRFKSDPVAAFSFRAQRAARNEKAATGSDLNRTRQRTAPEAVSIALKPVANDARATQCVTPTSDWLTSSRVASYRWCHEMRGSIQFLAQLTNFD